MEWKPAIVARKTQILTRVETKRFVFVFSREKLTKNYEHFRETKIDAKTFAKTKMLANTIIFGEN
jgi:hypothetical protein